MINVYNCFSLNVSISASIYLVSAVEQGGARYQEYYY